MYTPVYNKSNRSSKIHETFIEHLLLPNFRFLKAIRICDTVIWSMQTTNPSIWLEEVFIIKLCQ